MLGQFDSKRLTYRTIQPSDLAWLISRTVMRTLGRVMKMAYVACRCYRRDPCCRVPSKLWTTRFHPEMYPEKPPFVGVPPPAARSASGFFFDTVFHAPARQKFSLPFANATWTSKPGRSTRDPLKTRVVSVSSWQFPQYTLRVFITAGYTRCDFRWLPHWSAKRFPCATLCS